MARDRRKAALTVMVSVLVLEVVLLAVLAPRYGLAGAAAGVAVAALGGAVWSVSLIGRQVGTRPLGTLLRAALSAAMVGAALAFLTPTAPVWLLAAYPLAALAYGALLWLTREVGSQDVASLREALGR
jgi:O-antigen/teichoic acid export membrane protein